MRRRIVSSLAIALCLLGYAQTIMGQASLVGSVYQNSNIMAEELKRSKAEFEASIDSIRTATIAEAEKSKGQALTAAERAELEQQIVQARAVLDAMKTGVSVEFTSAEDLVMHLDVELNDEVLKTAGVSWAKRKMMKAAIAAMPNKHKAKYIVQGKLIITDDGSEKETMRLSDDRKFLYGQLDAQRKFKLTKTK
ncbi:MAG: hypothetical protein K5945_06495 [Bacteroidaceae bacterium]|nr:hypothetical protein [Bacteroidaceae bacterium]